MTKSCKSTPSKRKHASESGSTSKRKRTADSGSAVPENVMDICNQINEENSGNESEEQSRQSSIRVMTLPSTEEEGGKEESDEEESAGEDDDDLSTKIWHTVSYKGREKQKRAALMAKPLGTTGEFFRRRDEWQKHPMLTNQWRHATPGLGIALVTFGTYFIGETAYNKIYALKSHYHSTSSTSH